MEIKLQDFPCFYYTAKYGTKTDQIKYYVTVCSMLGYSMEEAAKSSVYFSHVTKGRLFSNGPYTAELLQNTLDTCFKNDETIHCGKLASKKRNSLKDIVNKSCSICPLSSMYLNSKLRDEFIYLKGAIEHPKWLEKFALDSSQFSSMQSLSLNNDVSFGILPIASMLHSHLCSVNIIRPEKLASDLCTVVNSYLVMEKLTDPSIVSEVPPFVNGILRQIMNVVPEEITEPLMHTAWQQINSGYMYTPPRTVLPLTENSQAGRHERKKAILPLDTSTGNEKNPGNLQEEKKQSVLQAEQKNILAEQGKQMMDNIQFSTIGATMGTMLGLMNMSPPNIALEHPMNDDAAEESKIPETANSTPTESPVVPIDSMQTSGIPTLEEPVVLSEEETLFPEREESDVYYDAVMYDTVPMEDVPADLELTSPDELPMAESVIISEESTKQIAEPEIEPPVGELLDCTEMSSAGINTEIMIADADIIADTEPNSELGIEPKADITSSDEIISTALALASFDVCSLCSIGVSPTYFNNVLRTADAIQYAFFLRCMSHKPEKERFAAMRNKNGCALCPRKGRHEGCVYPSLSLRDNIKKYTHKNDYNTHINDYNTHISPFFTHSKSNLVHKINIDFIPYIISCTDSQKSNLIDFISEACNATEIAIECVELHAVKGLLFYVGGKFYFFDPAYGASGFLKPLLSDATKTRFYSVNPIQVHACLYQIGFKHIRIESVAALFSTCHNLDVLAPVGIIFAGHMHKAYIDDMYAHIMPYYSLVWNDVYSKMNAGDKKNYEYGIRLEYALGKNKDISCISLGHEHNVVGGNYLHYRLTMRHLEDLNVPGCHIVVTINNTVSDELKKKIYEVTAGKIGASTSRVHDYTYLLSLSPNSTSYYCCYEDKVFFDELMSCLRSAFKEVVGGTPDVSVERTYFRF